MHFSLLKINLLSLSLLFIFFTREEETFCLFGSQQVLETIFRPTAPVSVEMLLRMEPFCSEEIASCPRKRLQFEPIEEKLLGAAYEAMENMIKKGTLVERFLYHHLFTLFTHYIAIHFSLIF